MKALKLLLIVTGVGLFLAAFYWLLTNRGPLAPVGVRAGSVIRADISPSVFGIGTVDARLAYAVGPVAPGRVLRVLVDQGAVVKAGQLLAEMDPVDMDLRVQAAKSAGARSRQSVRVAEAQVEEARSRAKLAKTNQNRDRALYQKGVISEQALDSSNNEAERAESALAAARANVALAKQEVGRTRAESRGISSVRDSLRIVSPVTLLPLSKVPLLVPRSTSAKKSPRLRISAWRRETSMLSRVTSQLGSRPMLSTSRSNSVSATP